MGTEGEDHRFRLIRRDIFYRRKGVAVRRTQAIQPTALNERAQLFVERDQSRSFGTLFRGVIEPGFRIQEAWGHTGQGPNRLMI